MRDAEMHSLAGKYDSALTLHERCLEGHKLRSTSSASRMMSHRDVKRMIASVARRVAAVTSVRGISSLV
jgi:hypothetical protein